MRAPADHRAERAPDVEVEAAAKSQCAETADMDCHRARRAEHKGVRAGRGREHGFILRPLSPLRRVQGEGTTKTTGFRG
jgi:hypothetical protein